LAGRFELCQRGFEGEAINTIGMEFGLAKGGGIWALRRADGPV
jgi:hypothetical protein